MNDHDNKHTNRGTPQTPNRTKQPLGDVRIDTNENFKNYSQPVPRTAETAPLSADDASSYSASITASTLSLTSPISCCSNAPYSDLLRTSSGKKRRRKSKKVETQAKKKLEFQVEILSVDDHLDEASSSNSKLSSDYVSAEKKDEDLVTSTNAASPINETSPSLITIPSIYDDSNPNMTKSQKRKARKLMPSLAGSFGNAMVAVGNHEHLNLWSLDPSRYQFSATLIGMKSLTRKDRPRRSPLQTESVTPVRFSSELLTKQTDDEERSL